jgi:hypothetical protein
VFEAPGDPQSAELLDDEDAQPGGTHHLSPTYRL